MNNNENLFVQSRDYNEMAEQIEKMQAELEAARVDNAIQAAMIDAMAEDMITAATEEGCHPELDVVIADYREQAEKAAK